MAVVQQIAQDVLRQVFGDHTAQAVTFAELLAEHGIDRGLIGPRELDRLWDRHLLNSAVLAELVPEHACVVDVGSGAGLPGIPLAIARPDLHVTLLEPMARRVTWLSETAATLKLDVTVMRGRAEEPGVLAQLGGADVVTARAVAPLERLATWCLPLLRPGGRLLAIKGATATDELARDAKAVARLGGSTQQVALCGTDVVAVPTVVIVVERDHSRGQSRLGSRTARRRDVGRQAEKDR